ncbi:hypothetical protein ACFRCW_33410 [Streptomyces sp. NPDC056653]|uniref:hypothetical protein n=1 Tax=Streptomyces sp. NPDC056653 TaxID=3345894 RepID=UPI00368A973D
MTVAAAFYLTGIAPEPAFGSAAWWGLRVPWLLVLGVVLVGVLLALRPLERRQALLYERIRPDIGLRRPWPLWLGLATSVAALSWFAMRGFAYGGRFPVLPALSLAVGTTLVMASRRTTVHQTTDESKNTLRKAA